MGFRTVFAPGDTLSCACYGPTACCGVPRRNGPGRGNLWDVELPQSLWGFSGGQRVNGKVNAREETATVQMSWS